MLLFFCKEAGSWWGAPHYTVAKIAETMLSEDQLKYINDVLFTWDSEKAIFRDTANWHDDLKPIGMPLMAGWHFRNQPIYTEDYNGSYNDPISYNITQANMDCIESIMNPETSSIWMLGFCFRLLSHFVADAHCPVHSAGRWSQAFPDGDRGGNSQAIVCDYGQPCRNMHMLWDSACLDFQIWPVDEKELPEYEKNVTNLINNYQPEKFFPETYTSIDPVQWESEAYSYAEKYTYGMLPDDTVVNGTYIQKGADAAKQLISTAGFRLATVMQSFFDVRKNSLPAFEPSHHSSAIYGWVIDGILLVVAIIYTIIDFRSIRMGAKFDFQQLNK